jgi:hypothetical protein
MGKMARVTGQSKLSTVNRSIALVLAVVWLLAGVAAIGAGLMHSSWLPLLLGVFALAYAFLWLRVVAKGRLLTWADVVAPWRRR